MTQESVKIPIETKQREKLLEFDHRRIKYKGRRMSTKEIRVMLELSRMDNGATIKELGKIIGVTKRRVWVVLQSLSSLGMIVKKENYRYSLNTEAVNAFEKYFSSEDDAETLLMSLGMKIADGIAKLTFEDAELCMRERLDLDETEIARCRNIFGSQYKKKRVNLVNIVTLLSLRKRESSIMGICKMTVLGYDEVDISVHNMLGLGLISRESQREPYRLTPNIKKHLDEFLDGKVEINEFMTRLEQEITFFAQGNLCLTINESTQVEKLKDFDYIGEKVKCKGRRISSSDILTLIAISKMKKEVTFTEIHRALGKTPKAVIVSLKKLIGVGLAIKLSKGTYTLGDGIQEKLSSYLSNKELDVKNLLTNLGIQTSKRIDMTEELERCSKLGYEKLGLCKNDMIVLIAIQRGINKPSIIEDSTGLSQTQVLRCLSKLTVKGFVIHGKWRDPYVLPETTNGFFLGKINADTLTNMKLPIEEALNLSAIEIDQLKKLMAFDYSQLNILVNSINMTTLVATSKLNKVFSRATIQKLLGLSICQAEKSLRILIELKFFLKLQTGKYTVISRIQEVVNTYLANGSSSVIDLLLTIEAIRLKNVDLKVLLEIANGRRPFQMIGSLIGSRTVVFGSINRLEKLEFIKQMSGKRPYFLTDYAEKYLLWLTKQGKYSSLSEEELGLIMSRLAEGLPKKEPVIEEIVRKKTKRKRSRGKKRRKQKRPRKTEKDRLLEKLRRLEGKLEEEDWKLLAIMIDHKSAGFNHVVFGVDDLSTPEINHIIENPIASYSRLKKAGLIENDLSRCRDCQPSELGRAMLILRNTKTKK